MTGKSHSCGGRKPKKIEWILGQAQYDREVIDKDEKRSIARRDNK
jgi:hypothetical protein